MTNLTPGASERRTSRAIYGVARGGARNILAWFPLFVVVGLAVPAQGADLLVPQDFPTIQLAINAAINGDRVLVSPGTYSESLDLQGKTITIDGTRDASSTVLQSPNGLRILGLTEESSSPVFSDVTFTGAQTESVVSVSGGAPVFERCIFRNNIRGAVGDGRPCQADSGATFLDCLFLENSSPNGGAVYLYATNSTFLRCAFIRNSAQGPTGGVNAGGSVYVNDWDCGRHTFVFEDCTFSKGQSVWGGAIYSQGTFPNKPTVMRIDRCVFWANTAASGSSMWNFYITAPVTDSWFCGPDPIQNWWSDSGTNTFLASCSTDPPYPDCNNDDIPDHLALRLGIGSDIDGNGVPDDCQTSTVPGEFSTVQEAIDAAPASGMRIVQVEAGIYTGAIDFLGKRIVLRGAGAASTVLRVTPGLASASVLRLSGTPDGTSIENLTISGGMGSPISTGSSTIVGGGLYASTSTATIRDVVFENNSAQFGGGVYALNSRLTLERCAFRNDAATEDGGGFQSFGGTSSLTDCTLEANTAGNRGGGMHLVGGSHTLLRTNVVGNASSNDAGGISWVPFGDSAAFLAIRDCEVRHNYAADDQGGIGITPFDWSGRTSLQDVLACGNFPQPNVGGPFDDLGGNSICGCPADLTSDGVIDGDDLGALLAEWGTCAQSGCAADIVPDGEVNGMDLGLLLSDWGACPVSTPPWATLVESTPDPSVVTSSNLRKAIIATGWAWRVRDAATGIEMLLVPPGRFEMGCVQPPSLSSCWSSELPVRTVTLTRPYYLGRYEVTQAQWQSVTGSNPSLFTNDADSPMFPVERVGWTGLQGFLSSTSMRLPTEAEWEMACRAGTSTPFHSMPGFPDGTADEALLLEIAWIQRDSTTRVGTRFPNALGFHDMLGNVYEWVSDWYGHYPPDPAVNPTGPASGSHRVVRGGSYCATWCDPLPRASHRRLGPPTMESFNSLGVRVARDP